MNIAVKPLIAYGWLRVLLFLALWMAIAFLADLGASFFIALIWPVSPVENVTNIQTLFRFLVAALATTLVVFIFRKWIDRKDFTSLGFQFKSYQTDAWIGFFTAPAAIGLGTLILIVLKYLHFSSIDFNLASLFIHLLLMLVIAWSEELVVRGYMLNNLLQSFNKWVALSITAVFFALLHLANPEVTVLSVLNILVAGFLLGINYIYTRNLWFGIFFHFSWNFFQGPVFGYEVSGLPFKGIFQQIATGPYLWTGGPFGFEGSLLCVLLLLAATIVFNHFFLNRTPRLQQQAIEEQAL